MCEGCIILTHRDKHLLPVAQFTDSILQSDHLVKNELNTIFFSVVSKNIVYYIFKLSKHCKIDRKNSFSRKADVEPSKSLIQMDKRAAQRRSQCKCDLRNESRKYQME